MAAINVLSYTSPRLVEVLAPDVSITVQELTDLIKQWEHDITNLSYDHLVNTSGKESLGGGVVVGITAELQNTQVAFAAQNASDSAGTATTADAAGTTLTDSSATFISDGVVPGDSIYNTTDGSVATVISVDFETQIKHFALADGTDNDWDSGDAYKIWNKVQCTISGGNLVAVDGAGDPISAIRPSVFTYVINTLSSSATLTNTVSAATLADAVWDETLSGHLGAGSTGAKLNESGGGANVLIDTTIASVTSQTLFTLTAGSDDNDAYNGQAIVLYDASDNSDPSIRVVTDYVGASKTVTIDAAPDFTIVSGDPVKVFVTAPGTTAPTAATIADAVWDEATSGHVASGSFGKEVQDIRTSQQKEYRIHFNGSHRLKVGNGYRAKLFVLNYEADLVDAASTPTITIYRPNRTTFASGASMTKLSTGIYEYTATIGSGQATGTWEAEVTVNLGGAAPIKESDYFLVTTSGA